MKALHRKNGSPAGSTMTVKEVIVKLLEYPMDMPVFGTWEGVNGYIGHSSFEVDVVHKGLWAEACDCLLIDVEEY